MALNEIYRDADFLELPVLAGTESGDPVQVGGLNGVALTDRDTDGNASVALKGGYEFTVDFEVTEVGQPIYLLADGSALTDSSSVPSTNALFGHALNTKAATSGALTVRLAN